MILIDSALFPATGETIDVRVVEDSADEFIMSETFTVSQRLKCVDGARVEFENLLGGFDSYTFVEAETMQSAKVQNYQGSTWNTAQIKNTQKIKVIGKMSDPDTLDWLSEILTSRQITVDNDNAVILSDNLTTDSRDYRKPVLILQKDDKVTN